MGVADLEIAKSIGHIGSALGSLFGGGGFEGFFNELFQAVPGIGIFLVIYTLMMFISKITIFKADEHKKFAQMFGIGVSLIAITNNSVYNFLTSVLAGTFIQIILILTVVFGIIILLNTLNKHRHEAREGMNNAAAKGHEAVGRASKTRNELLASTRLASRERKIRSKTSNTASNLDKYNGESIKLIDQMQLELAHAANLQSKGESTRAIRQGVLDSINSHVASLNKEHDAIVNLNREINTLKSLSLSEFKLDEIEKKDFSHIESLIKNESGRKVKFSKSAMAEIERFALKAVSLNKEKIAIIKKCEAIVVDEDSTLQQTIDLQRNLTNALRYGQIAEASASLAHMKAHLIHIENENNSLKKDVSALTNLIRRIRQFHKKERTELVNKIK